MIDRHAAHAAMQAARAALVPMTSAGGPAGAPAVALSGVLEPVGSPLARATAAWTAVEGLLQLVAGRSDLTGQPLIAAAGPRMPLDDANALAALHGWLERQRADAAGAEPHVPGSAEMTVAQAALGAVERAQAQLDAAPRQETGTASGTPLWTSPPPATAAPATPPPSATASAGPAPVDARPAWSPLPDASAHGRSLPTSLLLLLIVAGLALAGAGAWWWFGGRAGGDAEYQAAVAAYARGDRDAARSGFARVAQAAPNDARPLVFLGRMSREEGDLARARRLLDAAVRADPASAVAQRELASALLADGNPELARRFYVRAIELDPRDRLAQGFLGCALLRLGRVDEARRWLDRAGPGEWTACAAPPVTR